MSEPTTILGKIGKKVGEEVKAVNSLFTNHSNNTSNPHSVTKAQVSLGNVENIALSTWGGSGAIVSIGTLSSGTIPYSLLSNVPDVNNITGNLSIGGNLTVGGTTTTLNTETVLVEDNIIELNMGSAGAETAQTSGVQVNRGVALTEIVVTNFGTFIEDSGSNYDLVNTLNGTSVQGKETYTLSGDNPNNYKIVWFSNPSSVNFNGLLDTTNPTWVIEQNNSTNGHGAYKDFSGGSTSLANGSSEIASSDIQVTSGSSDKATIIWDDNTGQAVWKFGLGNADADIKVKDVDASGVVSVASGSSLTINGVAIGDYSLFTAGLTLGKS